MQFRPNRLMAVAAVAGLALCGCATSPSSPGNVAGQGAETVAESPESPPSFDPPIRFDASAAVRLPEGVTASSSVTLFGTTAYVATPAKLIVVDTTRGAVTSAIDPEHQATYVETPLAPRQASAPPLLADVEGVATILFSVPVTIPGQGTTPARSAVELVAVRADNATRLWSVTFDIEDGTTQLGPPIDTEVVGVAGDVAVTRAGGATYGVSLAARKLAWRQPFAATAVTGDVAVGVLGETPEPVRVVGFSAVDGTRRWADKTDSYDARVQHAGLRYVVVTGREYGGLTSYYRLVDAGTGRAAETDHYSGRMTYSITCHYDGVAVTVCATEDGDWTGGLDASTGKWLWNLPDKAANRTSISVNDAWHGAVYGTTDNGPVVLDARTGADREPNPGAAPDVVDSRVGIARDATTGHLTAVPTAG